MDGPRVLIAVAAASGRIGYICFHEGRPVIWLVSRRASRSPSDAAEYAQRWINEHKPHFFITECLQTTRKGGKSIALTEAMQRVAAHNYLHDVAVKPTLTECNKYEEGKRLAERYPELKKRLPTKRHFYDSEPKNTVLIDALLLAETVYDGPDLPLPSPLPAVQS